MGIIFDTFNGANFIKKEGSLEKQIEELKAIPNYENNEKIKNQIKLLELGLKGEKDIEYELENANIDMCVLHDITIKYEDLKAQIDYIIVTKGYIYLVECKNLYGNIKIDKTGQFIRTYNNHTETIYSPYTQAVRHQDIMKKIKYSNANFVNKILIEKYFDTLWYKPLVVLSNSRSVLKKDYAPREIKNNTIRVDQLVGYIKKDLDRYDKSLFISKKRMLEIGNKLLEMNVDDYKSFADKFKEDEQNLNQNQEEVQINNQNILENNNENLKNKLIIFRKEKSEKMNVPAYYIFTNEELEEIISKNPKTINELRDILPTVKVKYHGKEIINIINNF